MKTKIMSVLLFFALVLVLSLSGCQKSQNLPKLKEDTGAILQKITNYQFGQSRENLTDLADLVRSVKKTPAAVQVLETQFLDFLKSDATLDSKLFVCKQLSRIGTEASVPVLSKMLPAEETSDMARYALERIDGEKGKAALREALLTTDGAVKIGMINSLGQLRDNLAVGDLQKLATDDNEQIAEPAIAALGNIGSLESAAALTAVKDRVTPHLAPVVYDAYLLCADRLLAEGNAEEAHKIYQELSAPDLPVPIRVAALRGRILAAGDEGVALILKTLQSKDKELHATAISCIRDLPKTADISSVAELIPHADAAAKVQLLTALADFGDHRFVKFAVQATKNGDSTVRIAALKALAQLGDETNVDLLAQMAAGSGGKESEAARESLARLRGEKVDQTIIAGIASAEPAIKLELIRAVGSRDAGAAVEDVLKTTKDGDRKVRVESFKVLSVIATPEYLPQLVDGLIAVRSEPERKMAQKTVTTVAHKIADENRRAGVLLEKLPAVKDVAAKSSLLAILGKIGDPAALPVLREAIKEKNTAIQNAAIQAFTDWPTDAPLNDLLELAKTSGDEVQKILALRGFIRLIEVGNERPVEETVKLYRTAMDLAKQPNEQSMIFSGLAKVKSLSALNMALSFLQNKSLQQEAELAAVQIAQNIYQENPQEARQCLLKIVSSSKNKDTVRRAQRVLDQMK